MKAISKWLQGVWLVLAVAIIVIVLDQVTKEWVRMTIPKYTHIVPIPALGQTFVFEHVENFGAAFGIMRLPRGIFVIIAVLVSVAILIYAPRLPADQKWIRVIFGLQVGGALGNAIDRMIQGYVTDFIRIGVPGVYYWPNFNIADSAIVVGVISLGVLLFREDVKQERAAKARSADSAPAQNKPAPSKSNGS